ncbi:hypothetical protein MNBD_GAMMA12-1425 [hydrothermal vent metagenome]|uniref:Sulfatase-modifying factor enzyme-like domain-containing protein n=1 Tax=hydrothermal vent metagenome TaxID=652676 RepID=A0A3B0Y2C0_9ZZZZ
MYQYGGLTFIGNQSNKFAYDNEEPVHKVYLEPFQFASQPVLNGEYQEFIDCGGYHQSCYWLSDAWKVVNQQQWHAPLYWEKIEGKWWYMTLAGMQLVDGNAPVCHVSYFEALAYARWKSLQQEGVRLATEFEWEYVARNNTVEGNLRNFNSLQPMVYNGKKNLNQVLQLFGDVWEWTQSSYSNYPGYHSEQGPLGEYNGKFMSGQVVLRGGSCVTPADHIRATYRNFFYPLIDGSLVGFV